MASLAVKIGWSPIGETAYTLINKVQNLNTLNQVDVKRVFLNPDKIRFNSKRLDKSSFNFKGIMNSTGWTSEMLALSFQDDFPCLDSSAAMNYYNRISKINRWHDKLQICSECFVHGVHLIFHQSPDWEKCPIHHIDLQQSCVTCGAELEAFEACYTQSGFCCNHCGFNPFSRPDNWTSGKLEKAKVNLAVNYLKWVTETNEKIRIAHHGRHNKEYIWATPTTGYDNLSSFYRLYGGPSWLGKNLKKPNKLVRHKLSDSYKIIHPRNTTNATQIDSFHGSNYSYSNAYRNTNDNYHLQKLRYNNIEEILKLFDEAVKYVDKEIVKASPCLTSTHDLYRHSCIRSRYSQWEKELRSLSFGGGGISFFWSSWLAGPGRDFRISVSNKEEPRISNVNKNQAYTLECTRIWMRTKLMEAARKHFSAKYDWRIERAIIEEEPKYVLKTDPVDGGLVLHEVRSKESLKSVLKDNVCVHNDQPD